MFSWIKKSLCMVYRAGDNLVENDGIELAGYLAFLELLSLFPFLVIIVATAGFFGQGELGAQFINMLITHAPEDAVVSLKPRIEEIISGPPQGLLTISILGALWTSSSAVEGFRTVLNRAYNVSEPPHYFFRRLMSILQIVLLTVIVMFVMLVLVLTPLFFERIAHQAGWKLPPDALTFFTQDFVYIAIACMFVAVASLYYWLPNIKQTLIAVLPGAAIVVAGWLGGAALVSFYLDNVSQVNLIYGSLSGLIATLLFFFVMNIVFIYGAEFNHELLLALGKRLEEREHSTESPDDKVISKH
ncbi:MAG: YihY/virulence factor BrkB family protein [Alphaproteobacteria bacterium]|nr:YihY/virulence factor BrkB family protein [Alphaproteobacteria bacterium]